MAAAGGPRWVRPDIPAIPPAGYRRNAGRAVVGQGETAFEAARQRLLHWQTAPRGWCRFVHDGPARIGQRVATVAHAAGLIVTNACEVIDVTEESTTDRRIASVTYATLATHDVSGAERFRVTWERSSEQVTYEIESFSRPSGWLAWLTTPYVRRLQRRFVADSLREMTAALTPAPSS